MPTLVFACGAECGVNAVANTLAPDKKHWSTYAVGVSQLSGASARNGGRCFQMTTASGAAITVRKGAELGTAVEGCTRFYVYFDTSLPSADCVLFTASATAGGFPSVIFRASDSKIYAGFGSTPNTTTGVTVTTGVWYHIECRWDVAPNPRLCDVQVDGSACSQASSAVAGSTTTGWRFGLNGTGTTANATIRMDDIALSFTKADYPLGAGRIDALVPTADGTHNFSSGSNDFIYNAAGGSIPLTATDTFAYVDELLEQTGDTTWINAANCVAGEYVEWAVGQLPASPSSINGVEVVSSWHAAATQANKATLRVVDGASTVDAPADCDVSNTGIGYYSTHLATKPSGGAWTEATIEAVKLRFASSFTTEDVTPDVYCDGVRLEVDWIESAAATEIPPKPTIVSDAVRHAATW